jgi:hypothetical protein
MRAIGGSVSLEVVVEWWMLWEVMSINTRSKVGCLFAALPNIMQNDKEKSEDSGFSHS